MAYAVKKDGSGFRAVRSAADCTADEVFSENMPLVDTAALQAAASQAVLSAVTVADETAAGWAADEAEAAMPVSAASAEAGSDTAQPGTSLLSELAALKGIALVELAEAVMKEAEVLKTEAAAEAAESRAREIRQERQSLLAAADIMVNTVEDAGADAGPFRRYRQALRDITAQPGFPHAVVWPQAPDWPLTS